MARSEATLEVDRRTICRMIQMGCDREIAVSTVGWTEDDLRREFKRDPEFAKEVAEAEGQAELHHMRVVQKAIKDERHWRAATWWLQRRANDRRYRRSTHGVTPAEIRAFIEEVVDQVFNDISLEADRDKLAASLLGMARKWDPDNVDEMIGESGLKIGSDDTTAKEA